jgi:DNA-binding protein YbaB
MQKKISWSNLSKQKLETPSEQSTFTEDTQKIVLIGAHFPESVRIALKKLAIDGNVTLKDLFIEAIDDLMIKKGHSPLFASK